MKSNLRVPEGVQDAGRATNRAARNAASSHLMTVLARFGYAAKGIVYLIIGWLAGELAIGAGGKTTDQRGALQTIYEQPYGKFCLLSLSLALSASPSGAFSRHGLTQKARVAISKASLDVWVMV